MHETNIDIDFHPDEEPLASLIKLVETFGSYGVVEAMSVVEIFACQPGPINKVTH
jgi:hypothetical protein